MTALALVAARSPEPAAAEDDEVAMADRIWIGGVVHTLDPANPRATALAARDGRVLYVGDDAGARALAGDTTDVVLLDGATVVPGLVDAHAHVAGLGFALENVDLVGTRSIDEVRERVLARCAELPAGAWVEGRGWDHNDWPAPRFPSWRDLAGCDDHPVHLRRVDGHASWVNRAALDAAGIDRDTPDPPGGRVVRDDDGEPTGVLIDTAADPLRAAIPAPSSDDLRRRILLAQRALLAAGLTGVGDAGVDADTFAVYEQLAADGALRLRIYAMAEDVDPWVDEVLAAGPRVGLHDGRLTLRALKLYADGALGSRGAALLDDYDDDPGNRGLLVSEPAHLARRTERALAAGFQVATHAIGDRANRAVLDVYQAALAAAGGDDHRLRIEHAQVLHPDDLPRFAALGVIPSMQPTHATSDMPWAGDRIGAERLAGAYAWRRLLDGGARLPFGSDVPVESPDPLRGIHAAVTRQDADGHPAGGWWPDQRLAAEQALRGFTVEAAYAQFEEHDRGTIAVGKRADLTVLDRDLLAIPAAEILGARVVMTVIGGEVVYRAGGDARPPAAAR